MIMSSSLPLSFNPPFFSNLSPFPISKPQHQYQYHYHYHYQHSLSRSPICFSLSPSNYDREEARWLREEQRWLREEQRWLRQESRWHDERDSLLRQISALTLRIQELERRQGEIQGVSVSEAAKLLQVVNRISETGSNAVPMVLEEEKKEEVVVVKEKVVVEGKEEKKRKTLRKGSEGEDVRAMQEALQKLGFYCGEEDTEYSSFSRGTDRAVKTWQATFDAPEDGIMTSELLERLYMEVQIGGSGLDVNADPKVNDVTGIPKGSVNGAAVASVTEISEIQQAGVEGEVVTEVEVSEHRVFLLGENRWEEPSRLTGRNKQVGGTKSKVSVMKCLSCRGEGHLLCTECDGTGEPNIEPQFMEWIDEGAKCPYCEGRGYSICDVCEGKTVVV